jgi:hypothetical protein
MESDEVTRLISRLYHEEIEVEEAVEFMRYRNISAELVKSVYTELSTKGPHYHFIEVSINGSFNVVSCWTSRYLFAYSYQSPDSLFHDIRFFDLFNDKST